jgi:hypothetical protein
MVQLRHTGSICIDKHTLLDTNVTDQTGWQS